MTERTFSLVPFPGEESSFPIIIEGTIARRADRLFVRYALLGDLSGIAIPSPAPMPGRKDRLWEESCLELFFGPADSERYWEINLSPSGDWNVYRFLSERRGMTKEPAFPSLPFTVRTEPQSFRLSLDLEIGKIVPAAQSIEAAVCAIIKTVKGEKSHWSSAHPALQPDFHRREGFIFSFPGSDRP